MTVPVVGAALIIFGGLTSNPISNGLGIRPLAGLGLISYSLYLWHYPILALASVNAPSGLWVELVAVAFALTLAIVTYFLVETPFRRTNHATPFIGFSTVGVVTLLAFVTGSLGTSGYDARTGDIPRPEVPATDSKYGQVATAENSKGKVLLFGDSHMARLRLSLSEQATARGLDFMDGTESGCPFFEGITRLGHDTCTADFQAQRLAWAASIEPSFVVLGGRFPLSIEGSRFDNMEGWVEPGVGPDYVLSGATEPDRENQKTLVQESLKRTIESLLNQGHTVVLVYLIPEVGWNVPEQISRRASEASGSVTSLWPIPQKIRARLLPGPGSWPLDAPVTTSYDVYIDRTQSTFDALDSITSDRIIRIYPHKIFCDERDGGRCMTHDDDTIFYTDDDHLSASGALFVTAQIMKEISQWDSKP